jgi:hypothetical protein
MSAKEDLTMKRFLSTALAVVLLLSLGALAVLARGGGAILAPADNVIAAAAQPQTVAAPVAPAAGATKFNWIALPLHNASLVMASNLKAHIEANSNGTITVTTVEQWNSSAQSYQTFSTVPFPDGDFALAVGGVYRVSITGNAGAQVIWSMVGDVPDPSQFSYVLRETAGSDFNWIMLPLQKGGITMASGLKADIDANSHPSVTVITVEQWNPVAQSYQTYTTQPFPDGDFAVQIGYPYRLTVTAASPGTWP